MLNCPLGKSHESMKPSPSDFNRKAIIAGYWAGGFFCVLSLFSLSLGLAPLVGNLKKNLVTAELPGISPLDLKAPGMYVGVGMGQGLSREDLQKVADIEYSLSDADGNPVQQFLKIPRAQSLSDKQESRFPLFQFEAPEKGKYYLNSSYPYGMDGPKVQAAILHTDLSYVRVELFAGILLFVIFAMLGGYLIRKSYKAGKVS